MSKSQYIDALEAEERLKASAEDLFFALDHLLDAMRRDGVARYAYAEEMITAERVLRRAMGATE